MVFEEKGWVYIRKCCPEHGEFEGLVEKDADFYRRFAHLKYICNIWFDKLAIPITYRCNLDCKYCYAWFLKRKDMPLSQIRKVIRNFRGEYVCLSGGEPTLREDLEYIIRLVRNAGKRALLVTNGLKLSDLKYLRSLKKAGLLEVFFSLDSFKTEFYHEMKREKSAAKDALSFKKEALLNLEIERIYTRLSVTIYPGLNDKEINDLFIFALKKSHFISTICVRSCINIGRSGSDLKDGYFLSELLNLFSKQINIDKKTLIDKYLFTNYHTPHHLTFSLLGYLRRDNFVPYFSLKNKANLKRLFVRITQWPTIKNIDIQEVDRGVAHLYGKDKILNFCHTIILDNKNTADRNVAQMNERNKL